MNFALKYTLEPAKRKILFFHKIIMHFILIFFFYNKVLTKFVSMYIEDNPALISYSLRKSRRFLVIHREESVKCSIKGSQRYIEFDDCGAINYIKYTS